VERIASETTHRHDPAFRCPSELQKRQHPQQHANVQADDDAQHEWEAPYLGSPAQSGCRVTFNRSLTTGARMVAVPDRPSSRSQ
jgi:hypothetical protein